MCTFDMLQTIVPKRNLLQIFKSAKSVNNKQTKPKNFHIPNDHFVSKPHNSPTTNKIENKNNKFFA